MMFSAQMTSTHCYVLDVNIRHCYTALHKQTCGREKDNFTTKCTVIAVIFEDSVGGVILVAVVKINKQVESASPRSGVHMVGFC